MSRTPLTPLICTDGVALPVARSTLCSVSPDISQASFLPCPSDQMSNATVSTLGPSLPTALSMPSFGGACLISPPIVASML